MKMTQQDLKAMAERCAAKLLAVKEGVDVFSEPFRHVVVDSFFDTDYAKVCSNGFPPPDDAGWERAADEDIEVKQRTDWKSEFDVPDAVLPAIRILNSSIFLQAMSKVMLMPKLIPDPYFTGGGLNVTMRGGLLDVHVDGNYHDATGLNRRLNALVYFNEDWNESWGGEFGIYDETGDECVKKVPPLFNRLVIFDSHDKSFHGLPDPVSFPVGVPRKSIILYYYTKAERPSQHVVEGQPHSALWKKRGLLDKRGGKTRKFS
jgi:hypothetical protein